MIGPLRMSNPIFISVARGVLVVDPGGPEVTDDDIPLGYERVPGMPYRFVVEDEEVLAELEAPPCRGCRS